MIWGINAGGADGSFASFNTRTLRGQNNLDAVGSYDYEMRFTASGGRAFRRFSDGEIVPVPFELWQIGIGTLDDPADDVRMIPIICESTCGAGTNELTYDIGGDHRVSGGDDDPNTDWIYWYLPVDQTPGQSGYESYRSTADQLGEEVFARTVLVALDHGIAPPYTPELPEEGTVFRISTLKPFLVGDQATFSTAGFESTPFSQSEQTATLDAIGIVPNPYTGASRYETTSRPEEVRFTDMPFVATIRVFALNGSLVRTIEKRSADASWFTWDLRTDTGRQLASGIYLIHVEIPGVGQKVIKFGYIGRRWGD
ncbi:MAG: hypothetical protein HKN13_15380 [Rhodothermales bacterium]|nr:hypothetical protein [Rhodothermales bacterium]